MTQYYHTTTRQSLVKYVWYTCQWAIIITAIILVLMVPC